MDPTPEKLYLYELKTTLFDNVYPEEFMLFIWNFNMTLKASETLNYGENIQYHHTLLRGEWLCQFYMLSARVGIMTS